METATQLIVAWSENGNAKTELARFLDSPTGRAAITLLKEMNRPVKLPELVAGVDQDKVDAGRLQQAIGWNRCIDQLVAMCYTQPIQEDNLQPWAHYGEAENENKEPTR